MTDENLVDPASRAENPMSPAARERAGLCTARSKQSGLPCNRLAMRGKSVCDMHGGKSPSGPGTGRPITTGLRSKYAKNLTAALQEVEGMRDPRLEEELALTRSLLTRLDELFPRDGAPLTDKAVSWFVQLIDQTRRLVEAMKKPQPDLGVVIVRLQDTKLLETLGSIIVEEAGGDCAARIAQRFTSECSRLLPVPID